jgi:hypothetical protein
MLIGVAREGRDIILCGKWEITNRVMHKISDYPIRRHVKTALSVKEAIDNVAV